MAARCLRTKCRVAFLRRLRRRAGSDSSKAAPSIMCGQHLFVCENCDKDDPMKAAEKWINSDLRPLTGYAALPPRSYRNKTMQEYYAYLIGEMGASRSESTFDA